MSNVSKRVLDSFLQWKIKTYGSIREVKFTCRKIHEYLEMKMDYNVKWQVSVDMSDYVENMVVNPPPQDC